MKTTLKDSLGDRMKRYESVPRLSLSQRIPVIVRLDGKAFHTFTRSFPRPFDHILQNTMIAAAKAVAAEMQGFKIAYTQSDEVSFLLTDYDTVETCPWFDYDQQKLATVAASIMTAHFNQELRERIQLNNDNLILKRDYKDDDFSLKAGARGKVECKLGPGAFGGQDPWYNVNYGGMTIATPASDFISPPRDIPKSLAYFDGRAYNVPREDVSNYFLWRAKDWERNSLTMYASAFFSHKQLHGKSKQDRHDMLHSIGKNWTTDLDPRDRNGTFFKIDGKEEHYPAVYDIIAREIFPLVNPDRDPSEYDEMRKVYDLSKLKLVPNSIKGERLTAPIFKVFEKGPNGSMVYPDKDSIAITSILDTQPIAEQTTESEDMAMSPFPDKPK